jgi:radical SAM superfamily enzyme YgiQ (UPF0313 family)
MKIVLIEPKSSGIHVYAGIKLPRLGLPIIGAILRDLSHQVDIFYEEITLIDREFDWEEIKSADLIGISSLTCTIPRSFEIADEAKKMGKLVVMGGPHVTFLPDEALDHCDFVVRGEGEETIIELVEWIEQKKSIAELEKIAGLSFLALGKKQHNPDRPLISDLSRFPFADFSLIRGWGKRKNKIIPFQYSRGCPGRCPFCSVIKMFGRKMRYYDAQASANEIIRLQPKEIFFYDDNFGALPKKTEEFLEKIPNIPWSGQFKCDVYKNPEFMQLMKQKGCKRMYIGFESVNSATLKNFEKNYGIEDARALINACRELKIDIHGMFITGTDEEKPEDIQRNVDFTIQEKICSVQFTMFTPLPGTQIFEEMKAEGRLIEPIDWEKYNGHFVVFFPKRMTPWQLQIETIKGYAKFYSKSRWWKFVSSLKIKAAVVNSYARKILEKWEKELKEKGVLERLKNLSK